jgi:hypothetical protein
MGVSQTIASILMSFLIGWIVMLGFKYLHHDVRSVPAIGYWAAFFPTAAVVAIGRSINGKDFE